MRIIILFVLAVFSLIVQASAQTSRDYAVLLSLERVLGQFGITWPRDSTPATYYIRVRSLETQPWRDYDTLTNESEDLFVIPPSLDWTELELEKRTIGADGKPISAFGYFLGHGTGDLARWQRPGRVLLVIDREMGLDFLSRSVGTWRDDVEREGWIVQYLLIDSDGKIPVDSLYHEIAKSYNDTSSGAALTHVLIVGNVPYAYSGGFTESGPNVQPDGHTEHGGAWSSDARYADIETSRGIPSDEQWTDETVDISDSIRAKRIQNKNVPSDSKYDQSQIPTDAELCIGRVDMRNLPAFGTTSTSRGREIQLLDQYFDRVHAYRTKATRFDTSARIDDNFGAFTSEDDQQRLVEAFAAGAWRGFSPITGSNRVSNGEFLDTVPTLLAYGCGGGGYDHCDGIANTTEFVTKPIRSSFIWLFGSYFADIDSEDNIMRAALANPGNVLTCAWSGRPDWVLHPLAAMHSLGEVTRGSINNAGTYRSATIYSKATGEGSDYAYGQRGIHINLLGDPTLRMPAPAMTGELSITERNDSTILEWNGIDDALTFIIEAGVSLSKPMTIVANKGTGKTTPRVSITLQLPPGSRYVRVRPLFGTLDQSSFTPILGRGLIGSRDVSSVADNGAAQVRAHYVDGSIVIEGASCVPTTASLFDLQGRELCSLTFMCSGSDLRAQVPTQLRTGVYFVRNFKAVHAITKTFTPFKIYIQ
ncbi:MAG: hypothetical protein SGJ05_03440 [bacterium]|nr:hypothetical protein [bacterium]